MSRSRMSSLLAMSALLALTAAAAIVPATAAAAAEEPLTVVSTDVTAYPDVRMVVAAPAQLGEQPLTDAAFRVTEEGRAVPLRVEPLTAAQLEVSLVIDTSGSMRGAPLAAAKSAARSFLAQLPATVPVSVIGFGASPALVSARSSNRAAQTAAVDGLAAGGQTALYDALGVALEQLPGSGGRQVVVLLTDGGDTASAGGLDAAAEAVSKAGVAVFAVELRTSESNPTALGRLTSASGGRVAPVSDPAALAGAFDAIARQLVRQYALTYRSQARGGTDLDVVLEAHGLRATARPHLDLPVGPASATAPSGSERSGTTAEPSGRWALISGGALCGVAMLVLLLSVLAFRAPRARGLTARRRGLDLVAAVDRADALGEGVLRRRHGGVAALSGALDAAGVSIRAGEFVAGVAAAVMVVLVAGWVLAGPVPALVAVVLVVLGSRVGLDVLARRRRNRFADQMAETLQMLAGSLRAGHGLARSIDTVARETEPPTSEEFRRLTIETRLGRDFVEALGDLADRMGNTDFYWVVQAVEIQRDVGGDLAELLDTVAGTIRDRARIRRQVSALSAEGRMSAWVLLLLPFGLAGVMSVTNPDFLRPLFSSGSGLRLVATGLALLAVGGLWLRRIVKPIF